MHAWTDERIATLLKLNANGVAASAIALQLGGTSRNAVIGKLHRLGLTTPRNASKPKAEAPSAPKQPRARRTNPVALRSQKQVALEEMFAQTEKTDIVEYGTEVIPLAQRQNLAGLTGENCHWPIGQPGRPTFYYCGGTALHGLPYCASHARVAYRRETPSDRRVYNYWK